MSAENDNDGCDDVDADADNDNDRILDINDAFTLDVTKYLDTDDDGTGDNADMDDDGDKLKSSVDMTMLYSRCHSQVTPLNLSKADVSSLSPIKYLQKRLCKIQHQ